MNVVVLHEALGSDARADEADVLEQAAAVGAALDELGHRHAVVTMTEDLARAEIELRRAAPDVVFNLVESLGGSGRAVDAAPELLERSRLPYTGSGPAPMRSAASKLASKRILDAHSLPTPASLSMQDLRAGACQPTGRYILKSVWEHGSLGLEADCVVSAASADVLRTELERRLPRLGGEAFAESYVHGREFNLGLLADGDRVQHLPPAEIRFTAPQAASVRIVGYRAKWSPGSIDDTSTQRSFETRAADRHLVARLQALSEATWHAFGLSGYARVDLRVDEQGQPWIIDVNTNPCLSPDAGFAAAVHAAGMPFARAVERILAAALSRPLRH